MLALGGTYLLPIEWRPAAMAAVIAWLLAGAVYLLTLGRSEGIAVYAGDRLIGGLRMKVGRRKLWLAGILVGPELRGKGMFAGMLLAAFRLAEQAAQKRPLTVSVFAPAHPASKRVVEKYFAGKQVIEAGSEEFKRTRAMLEDEVKALEAKGIRYEYRLEREL